MLPMQQLQNTFIPSQKGKPSLKRYFTIPREPQFPSNKFFAHTDRNLSTIKPANLSFPAHPPLSSPIFTFLFCADKIPPPMYTSFKQTARLPIQSMRAPLIAFHCTRAFFFYVPSLDDVTDATAAVLRE